MPARQGKLFQFEGKKVEVTRIRAKLGDVASPPFELGDRVALLMAGDVTAVRFYRDKDKRLVREMVLDVEEARVTDELPDFTIEVSRET